MGQKDFIYTGGYQTWVVPAGVTAVNVFLNGAGSGAAKGGRVTGRLTVTPGKSLVFIIGRAGIAASGEAGGGYAFGGGAPGGPGKSGAGGGGGGGYSAIRRDTTSGTIVAAAGGAGGTSGDSGKGGDGGAATGESGSRGTSGSNSTGAATGGTPSQGGNGGTSSSGSDFNGGNATDVALGTAGTGGSSANYSYGGGGGGGGWRAGGGGQAASKGYAPGGGGGGGSNYTGGLTGATTVQGYLTGNGAATITWTNPTPSNQPPSPPTSVDLNGQNPPEDKQVTKKTTSVSLTAILNDPEKANVRLLIRYTHNVPATWASGTYTDLYSPYVANGSRTGAMIPLVINQFYSVRLYTQDKAGLFSTTYAACTFWSDRTPDPPDLLTPAENASIPSITSTVFTWKHIDPDSTDAVPDPMRGWQLQYRTAGTATVAPGPWTLIAQPANTFASWTVNPGTFRGNTFYEWQVRTSDASGFFGEWAVPQSFFAVSTSTPPNPTHPVRNLAENVSLPIAFTWQFIDPDPGDVQSRADIRYRVVGQPDTDWVTMFGAVTPGTPGRVQGWTIPAGTFQPGYNYEWQVRTYDTLGTGDPSGWSASGFFWAITTPGGGGLPPVVASPVVQGALGCGEYRVYVYAQGGKRVIGEITPMSSLNFKRVRDDISNCVVLSNGFGEDCCALYANLRCWMHEIVVFRSGVRVWEGPITRIGYRIDQVEIEAKDVMGYLYRRILRQGYNDSYQTVPGSDVDAQDRIVLPTPTTVQRAQRLIMNALAPFDPNVLPYLTTFEFADDAKESNIVADYSQTTWEAVDALAATNGLDYTVVGRRIILWDTHRAIGKLPEMRDGDFSDPPVVTEYGMQLCNYLAVTNGSGIWGAATPKQQTRSFQAYGPVEMVASDYAGADTATSDVMTNAARTEFIAKLVSQAERNIDDRWPTPVIVRVPDNSTLSPEVGVGFDQLVPGVWIPLRSAATCREVVQWQKLDSITVNVDAAGGEQVQVVMSPAPNGGDDDPDKVAAAEAAD